MHGLGYARAGVRGGDIGVRTVALILAALLAVPAALVLLRPTPPSPEREQDPPRRALDGLWAVVPLAFLLALIGFAATA